MLTNNVLVFSPILQALLLVIQINFQLPKLIETKKGWLSLAQEISTLRKLKGAKTTQSTFSAQRVMSAKATYIVTNHTMALEQLKRMAILQPVMTKLSDQPRILKRESVEKSTRHLTSICPWKCIKRKTTEIKRAQ